MSSVWENEKRPRCEEIWWSLGGHLQILQLQEMNVRSILYLGLLSLLIWLRMERSAIHAHIVQLFHMFSVILIKAYWMGAFLFACGLVWCIRLCFLSTHCKLWWIRIATGAERTDDRLDGMCACVYPQFVCSLAALATHSTWVVCMNTIEHEHVVFNRTKKYCMCLQLHSKFHFPNYIMNKRPPSCLPLFLSASCAV